MVGTATQPRRSRLRCGSLQEAETASGVRSLSEARAASAASVATRTWPATSTRTATRIPSEPTEAANDRRRETRVVRLRALRAQRKRSRVLRALHPQPTPDPTFPDAHVGRSFLRRHNMQIQTKTTDPQPEAPDYE